LSDKVVIVPNGDRYSNSAKFVVMGGVTYPAKVDNGYGRRDTWGQHYDSYYFADMGEVDFTPSREALNMTTRTSEVVNEFYDATSAAFVQSYIQTQINAAKDLHEGVKVWRALKGLLSSHGVYNYKDTPLRDSIGIVKTRAFDPLTQESKDMTYNVETVKLAEKDSYLFVTNRPDGKSLSKRMKYQIRAYIEKKSLPTKEVFFGSVPDNALYSDIRKVRWSTLEKIEVVLPKVEREKREPSQGYKQMSAGQPGWNKMPIPKGKKLVGIEGPFYRQIQLASKVDSDTVFVHLGANRVDKFFRDYPNALTWEKYREQLKKTVPVISEIEFKFNALRYPAEALVKALSNNQLKEIGDDTLIALSTVDKVDLDKRMQMWYNVGKEVPHRKDYVAEKYPLASSHQISHSVIYMAVIAKKAENK
jgi:hypothetical protein